MSQIIGGHTFVPLEKNIDDVKLNAITGGATITSELISTQTQSTSAVTGDQFLLLKAGGTLARILFDDLATSFAGSSAITNAINNAIVTSTRHVFSSAGNCNFEVDQINVGNTVANANAKIIDRWSVLKSGTLVVSAGQIALTAPDVVTPGTSFRISRSALRVTVTTAQASLAATDYLIIQQQVEGPLWRELQGDVHSVSLLVRSSVANLAFGFALRDPATATKSLTKLCTLGATPSTWTLVTLPNLPNFPTGNFTVSPGSVGYQLTITLAAGSTNTNVANDSWQGGNTFGAVGQSNFAANGSATFDVAFCQHEPGALCTNLMDCPFGVNLDGPFGAQRYYQKSYLYATAIGTVTSVNSIPVWNTTAATSTGPAVAASFKKTMAKAPTVTIYSNTTGNANSVVIGGTTYTVSSVANIGDNSFSQIVTSTAVAANSFGVLHYTADTGW